MLKVKVPCGRNQGYGEACDTIRMCDSCQLITKLQEEKARLRAALEGEPTPEMTAAGMMAWDQAVARINGIAWPEMMRVVFKAMASEALKGEGE